MNPTHQNHPLGLLRPYNEHTTHQLKIILLNGDGERGWSTLLDLNTRPDSERKFFLIEFTAAIRPPGGAMRRLDDEHSELTVPLDETITAPTIKDLSSTPLEEWMATMFSTFARCPSAVAVLCNLGQISTVLHGGESQ